MKNFCGKPLIHYTIDIAQRCGVFDKIIVSTDSDEIMNFAKEYEGITILKRPVALASDTSTTGEVAKHTLESIDDNNIRAFVTLQVTNPLRSVNLIKKALDNFLNLQGYDALIGVCESDLKLGTIENQEYKPSYTPGQRSQDMTKNYYENGSIYISTPEVIKKADIFGKRIFPYIMDPIYGKIDIDTPEEFEIAELVFLKYKQKIFDV